MIRSIIAAVWMPAPGMDIKTWERGKSSGSYFDFLSYDGSLVTPSLLRISMAHPDLARPTASDIAGDARSQGLIEGNHGCGCF